MARAENLPLLGPDDPSPVERLRPRGTSEFFLICEHAGRALPSRLGSLGLGPAQLERHIAYDIGAEGITRGLSRRLDASAVLQRYSRLVVDCNRWPHAEDLATPFSEDTVIPGNVGLEPEAREARLRAIHTPYHEAIRAALDARIAAARPTVLVSVHSCTPVYLGESRPWHVGVLYERDRRLAGALLDVLERDPGLVVGDNQPYFLTDRKDYAVPVHGERRGLLHVELEIRQDLVASPDGQDAWVERLAVALPAALARLALDTRTT